MANETSHGMRGGLDRSEDGRVMSKYKKSDVLEFLLQQYPEPMTIPEVANAIGMSEATARTRLEALEDDQDVWSKKIGARARIWQPAAPAHYKTMWERLASAAGVEADATNAIQEARAAREDAIAAEQLAIQASRDNDVGAAEEAAADAEAAADRAEAIAADADGLTNDDTLSEQVSAHIQEIAKEARDSAQTARTAAKVAGEQEADAPTPQ